MVPRIRLLDVISHFIKINRLKLSSRTQILASKAANNSRTELLKSLFDGYRKESMVTKDNSECKMSQVFKHDFWKNFSKTTSYHQSVPNCHLEPIEQGLDRILNRLPELYQCAVFSASFSWTSNWAGLFQLVLTWKPKKVYTIWKNLKNGFWKTKHFPCTLMLYKIL